MSNQHQRPASSDERDVSKVRAPTHAERCRTLVSLARASTLSTLAREPAGFPYGSLVTLATDSLGRPLFLLSTLAEHTKNLLESDAASVLVTEPLDRHAEPLAVGRVTILGPCAKLKDDERAAVRETFLAQQPSSAYYVDFSDFAFFRLEPTSLRYVGGFGRMSWVSAEDYRVAAPDPLASSSADILTHMNEDHADSVLAYAKHLAGIDDAESATMTAVDRYGFELAALTKKGPRATRLAFDVEVTSSEEVRRALIALVKRARSGNAESHEKGES